MNEDGPEDPKQRQISINDAKNEEDQEHAAAIATELVLDHHGKTNIHIVETLPAVRMDSQQPNMERIWEREEVFSSKYKPTTEELAHLTQIEIDLGIIQPPKPTTANKFGVLFRGRGARNVQNNILTDDDLKSAWNQMAHPNDQIHSFSIVLMFTHCQRVVHIQNNTHPRIIEQEASETSITTPTPLMDNGCCDLYLLTRGLAMAVITTTNNHHPENKISQLHAAIPWENVNYIVEPTTGNDATSKNTWTLVTKNGETYQFHNTCHGSIWFDAIRTALVRFHEHQQTKSRRDGLTTTAIKLGWQYKIVHRKYFTMAVTNDDSNMMEELEEIGKKDPNMDTLDEYNGYTPMHYAAHANHVRAMSKLLELGADPDVSDAVDGHTPVYYCVRDGFDEAAELLLAHGAKPVSRTNDKGELFGRVAATQALLEEKSRQEERKRQVEAAAAEIQKNNLRLLQQRGDKIDELGNKASELNQGAEDFASMAKQLKEKVKNKKWYQL